MAAEIQRLIAQAMAVGEQQQFLRIDIGRAQRLRRASAWPLRQHDPERLIEENQLVELRSPLSEAMIAASSLPPRRPATEDGAVRSSTSLSGADGSVAVAAGSRSGRR